ncbi:hypothetical protein [Methylomonas methanica]|uniref:Uncharacterized protein n=1 Tax=Methylomonas methanica TaxID=421 RepID=A0A177MPP9_METMH|nr:hypothetical protein [Methylomonas methanica]OAI07283.1 hypothetical protein A1332_09135 [Methylomonas methanica]
MNNWLDLAEGRAEEIDSGIVELIPSEIVSLKARELLSFQQDQQALLPPKFSEPIKAEYRK